MSHINLICPVCNITFKKRKAEYNRRIRKCSNLYCSQKCASKITKANLWKNGPPKIKNPYKKPLDELSPFRFYHHLINKRSCNRKECLITAEDLKEQWDRQKGICPYTGLELLLQQSSAPKYQIPLVPNKASVDRIDSSLPYQVGNIEFISLIAQYAKNIWDKNMVLDFCYSVSIYHNFWSNIRNDYY